MRNFPGLDFGVENGLVKISQHLTLPVLVPSAVLSCHFPVINLDRIAGLDSLKKSMKLYDSLYKYRLS